MTLASYCKNKGMDIEGYNAVRTSIAEDAQVVFDTASSLHPVDTGIYYLVEEIFDDAYEELRPYIIAELKRLGMEFFDNNTLYRI